MVERKLRGNCFNHGLPGNQLLKVGIFSWKDHSEENYSKFGRLFLRS